MCMADNCDDFVQLLDETDHVARKDHKCRECFRAINPGEKYHVDKYIFEGDFTVHKTCAHCMVARSWLSDECGGWMYGAVEEDVREHCTEGHEYPFGVYRLAVGMARKWTRRTGALMPLPALPMTTHERLAGKAGAAG